MSKIVVLGAAGQLGQCLAALAGEEKNNDVYFAGREEADILNAGALEDLVFNYQPEYFINCAAYTAVDKAEDESELAERINKTGAENLARICAKYHIVLIHISTDFVFEGRLAKLLNETDETLPVNVYGLTKLQGEQCIIRDAPKYFILRTSWLYSEFGNNFVKTMLRLAKEKDELKIINDQIGTPTYAMDLAACIFEIIGSGSADYGIYHYSNEGVASWYDFAKAIFDISGTSIKVLPVGTSEYITKAERPAFSVMDKSKVKEVFKVQIPYWRESLVSCLSKL